MMSVYKDKKTSPYVKLNCFPRKMITNTINKPLSHPYYSAQVSPSKNKQPLIKNKSFDIISHKNLSELQHRQSMST